VEALSGFHPEKEAVLLDGTVLKVARPGDVTGGCYDFDCARIKARIDWDELNRYFGLCDKARQMKPDAN
jgi:hypothetical protein